MSDPTTPTPLGPSDRRRYDRNVTRGISTLLGEVVDLSEGGLGVYQKGAARTDVGNMHELTIRHEQVGVTVQARVVRITPMGFRRREVGLELMVCTHAQREAIRTLIALTSRPEVGVGPRCWVAA